MEDDELTGMPGYVTPKKAALMLGLTDKRIHQLIRAKRLPARKMLGRYVIREEAVEDFKRSPAGRLRTQPPPWRAYGSGIHLKGRGIQVQIRPGQEETFEKKLQAMREEQTHLLSGTMLRHILLEEDEPARVHIWLEWKDNEADEETLARELADFKAEFADVLDWGTEQSSSLKGLLYT